jgi:L-malate glycosyltransferase
MNILFVINALSPGGAEVFLYRLSEALQANGNNVYVLQLHQEKNNESFVTLFKNSNITLLSAYDKPNSRKEKLFWKINAVFYKLGVKGVYNKLRNRDKEKYYKQLLKKHKIDIINSHLIESDNFAVNYLKKMTGIPVVITMHSSYNQSNINTQTDKLTFLKFCNNIFNGANFITYVADTNTHIFKLPEINLKTPFKKIYIGFEPSNKTDEYTRNCVAKLNTSAIKFGMIGRGIKEKGWEIAINAFEFLQKDYTAIQLILVCPETDYIRSLKEKYKSNIGIIFTGQLNKIEPIIKEFNIALLPSYSESLPVSIIEELTFCVPVIATDTGEIKQMLSDNDGEIAGAVFSEKEEDIPSTNKLYELMKVYLDSPEKINVHKKRAIIASAKFSMEKCVGEYIKVYEQVIKA